jgi:hypothetical protein
MTQLGKIFIFKRGFLKLYVLLQSTGVSDVAMCVEENESMLGFIEVTSLKWFGLSKDIAEEYQVK